MLASTHVRASLWWWAPAVLLGVGACDPSTEIGSKAGDLGKGQFRYQCLDADDTACKPGESSPEFFPAAIAAGGEFGLSYLAAQSYGSAQMSAPVPGSFARTNEGFRALRPGMNVVLVSTSQSGGAVVDFTHLTVVGVGKLKFVSEDGGAPRISLAAGERMTLAAVPQGTDGSKLAGRVACEWTSSDEGVLRRVTSSPAARAEWQAVAPGKVTITAEIPESSNPATTTFDVEVLP